MFYILPLFVHYLFSHFYLFHLICFFSFQVVANYIASSRVLEFVPGKKIHWPGNRLNPPLDSPVCGFDMSLCPDNCESILFSILALN